MEFVPNDRQIAVVAREKPAKEVQIALVALLLSPDARIQAVTDRCQPQIRGDLLSNLSQRGRIPAFGAPPHASILERVFGKYDKLGWLAVREPPFECRDFSPKDFRRRADITGVDLNSRPQL